MSHRRILLAVLPIGCLLAATGVFAATTDAVSTGALDIFSAEIGGGPAPSGQVDLRVSNTTTASGSSRACQTATDYVDDTTTPFITLEGALRGATMTRAICVMNAGDAAAIVSADLVDAVDVEVGPCLPSEAAAGDGSCADGEAGELADHARVAVRVRAGQDPDQPYGDRCDGNASQPAVENAARATASPFTLTGFGDPVFFYQSDVLAAGDAACVEVTMRYDAGTAPLDEARAQTDRVAVRLRFNGEPYLGGGEAPSYSSRSLYESPNRDAITRGWWAPGLNTDGFVPQGLARAVAAVSPYGVDTLFVSGYYDDHSPNTCAIYAVEEATGIEIDRYDALPSSCTHGDGIAVEPATGSLWMVAGPNHLYRVALDAGFVANDPAAVAKTLEFTTVGGDAEERNSNYVTFQPSGVYPREGGGSIDCPCLLTGDYQTHLDGPGFFRRYELSYLHGLPSGSVTGATERSTRVATPYYVQGAAVDASGTVWLSQSVSFTGLSQRGAVTRMVDEAAGEWDTHDFVRGGEGIVVSGSQFWGVSERGAKKFDDGTFFPVLYRFDPALLT